LHVNLTLRSPVTGPIALDRLRKRARVRLLQGSHYLESMLAPWGLGGEDSMHDRQIIHDLQTEGVHTTTVDRLLRQSAPAVSQTMARAAELLTPAWSRANQEMWSVALASTDLRAEVLLERLPQLYLLGLQRRILQLVYNYLRLPVAYHGAVLRHSLLDGKSAGPRLWHQDSEDFHVIRMLLYLSDIGPGCGPFEYIPRSVGLSYAPFRGAETNLTDSRMAAVVPREQWKRVTGRAGTIVLCDTGKVFHHESLAVSSDRVVVMFGFSSRRPRNVRDAMLHFPVERVTAVLRRVVPPENHVHVFDWRRPGL
jgi:hypothetical protein